MREFVPRLQCAFFVGAIVVGSSVFPSSVRAQIAPGVDLGGAIEVGGEAERYLRVLQLSGTVPITPWTILPFAAGSERMILPSAPHPWRARMAPPDSAPAWRLLRPTVLTTVNTTFPFQGTSGPMWSGKGATAAVQAGILARWGRLHLQLAPIAFIAQNAAFPLAVNGAQGDQRFGDARLPGQIDYPQRFGNSAYGRLDPGTSSLALDAGVLSTGVSSAPQRWGPGREYPLVLGPGAGGFPHLFVETTRPIDLHVARVQGKLIAGYLTQSAFSSARPDKTRRVASAAVIGVTPGGIDGLEVGFIRFFESTEPATLSRVLRPVSLNGLVGAIGKATDADNVANENQVASVFFRWALPTAGMEVYGEWYREDYPGDFRKLLLKPDDLSSFMLGFQRVIEASSSRRRVVRFEIVNGELSHQERGQRGTSVPIPPYVHSEVLQGHTQHGLLLGSPEAFGGAGWRASVDRYDERGRVTVAFERALRFDWLPGQSLTPTDVHPDVMYAVRVEVLKFAGRRDYTLTLIPAVDLNRNLVAGADRLNLYVGLGARGW